MRVEQRLTLFLIGGVLALVGFGGLALVNQTESARIVAQLSTSQEILSRILDRDPKVDRSTLQNLLTTLEPEFRRDYLNRYLQQPNVKNTKLVLESETRFQKYSLELAVIRDVRVFRYGLVALLVTSLLFFSLVWALRHWVFAPVSHLNQRMRDFLEDRYSYKFQTPAEHELGQLEHTFNMLAQRVLDQITALQSLDKAKSEFLSIASHELRTPLTSIKGSLSLMHGGVTGEVNDTSQGLMGIALGETDRLIRLINDLLDLAKIEARAFPLVKTWQPVTGLLEKARQNLAGFAATAKVQLAVEVNTPADIEGLFDIDRILQVVTNLASNAIKYSPEHGTVTLSATLTDGRSLAIAVRDQGKGISPADQALLFERFRQITGPESPLVKGTGLGLAISKALVEEHGGTIHVDSKPGAGSTFFFTLPDWRLAQPQRKQASA
jgi:signal transduction histidine kinase